MENNHEDRWVTHQMAATTPAWQPDAVRAGVALRAALRRPQARISSWAIAMMSAATLIAAIAFPQTRAMAQDLWAHLVLNRVDVVRLDFSKLPFHTHVVWNGVMAEEARNVDGAEQHAGYRPHLPVGSWGTPKVSVIAPLTVEQTINIQELEAALLKAHASNVFVAPEWEGVTLRTDIGKAVALEYPGEIEILQSRPFSITIPSGFPLEAFAEAAFRSVGASSDDARAMARKFAANPAWLLDVSPDKVMNIQELSLVSGPALLVEDYDKHGAVEKVTVIRSNRDRIYLVSTPKRDLSIRLADALPPDPR